MKSLLQILLPILLLSSARVSLPAADLPWRTDFAPALTAAAKEGQPVLVDFSAPWCTWCKFMDQTTFTDPTVRKALDGYQLVRVDYDRSTDLVARFGVKGIPALFLLNRFGETVARQDGYADPRAVYDWLTRNNAAARATTSQAGAETQKISTATDALRSADPLRRRSGLPPLIQTALRARGEPRQAALAALQSLVDTDPAFCLPELNHRLLAIRILFTSLYAKKLGATFDFDPWASPADRATAIATLQKGLAQ